MLLGAKYFRPHWPWLITFIAGTVIATLWYLIANIGQPQWLGGSSVPGFTFGVLGGGIILFEAALWLRKKYRAVRVGRVQVWMRAHIWLGLLTVPLILLHCGFQFGGPLTSAMMWVFFIIIASGVWGVILQNYLPQRMFHDVAAETIHSQIGPVMERQVEDLDLLIATTCGPDPTKQLLPEQYDLMSQSSVYLSVSMNVSVGLTQGKTRQTRSNQAVVPGSDSLRAFYEDKVRIYLQKGRSSRSDLAVPARADAMVRAVKALLDPAAHPTLDTVAAAINVRRQLDHQKWMHFWLHNWIWLHLPLSAALIVLMVIHVWTALKFW